jgi:tRNA (guanine37-N1)-methyltransferase
MRVDVLTLFPGLFAPFLEVGILGRAVARGLIEVAVHDLREHGEGAYRKVDDAPYGGGGGMVLMVGPLSRALDRIQAEREAGRVVLLSPQGRRLDQAACLRLAALRRLVLVCGRYEGIDERFVASRVDEEISIGDYVLSGGEVPALAVLEAVARLQPGALGDPEGAERDSFRGGLLDHPHYTRPEVFEGLAVPEVLLSGDHAAIAAWRRERALEATRRKRPDLLEAAPGRDETSSPSADGAEHGARETGARRAAREP